MIIEFTVNKPQNWLQNIADQFGVGLEDNTMIYLISDNGGASYTGATDNGPYKGGKLTMFEGGVNVPFIMKWKGHIPAGERSSEWHRTSRYPPGWPS